MRRQSRGWSICASLRITHVRRSIAFGSMHSPRQNLFEFVYALMWCVRRHDRDQWRRFLCHAPRIPLANFVPLLEHSSCAAASSNYVSGTLGHRRRAAEKHLAVGGNMNILFIRRRAKVVHVSCLVSSVFSRSTENVLCRLRYLHHGTLAATEHFWNSTNSNMQYEAHPPSP